ncbi:MAG: tRNA uridine-5-carboxymethylaminomethyl(34) synthesis GTPase MnmE [Alphaproteobacteria bacterium]|jgi:tRNA modification GTPase|nr:tRNA uridine-5-carboxymethylaminomethyl(34) synthesis GTPase MnmE [Alphaproteobacteria bacterium]
MENKNTIFALASAHGVAGVSVFRLSGERAFEVACDIAKFDSVPEVRKAVYTNIYDVNGLVIDSVIMIFFRNPNSFTGEDVVEVHTHGSRAVISSVLNRLSQFGEDVRLAERGEFSRRAFENGKMDLTEVEGLGDLIDATTEAQRVQAVRQLGGGLSDIYNKWREDILVILANYEAVIDFSEDDIPEDLQKKADEKISTLMNSIKSHLNDGKRGQILRDGLSVAIVGNPNVGKSSLFNKMLGEEKAIISSIAGTTRDVVEADLDIKGYPVSLADTAGIRETLDEIETEGIRRALKRAENANLLIWVADDLKEFSTDKFSGNIIKVLNKIDENPVESVEYDIFKLSIKEENGFEEFLSYFDKKVVDMMSVSDAPLITRERHRIALEKAVEFLNASLLDDFVEIKSENIRLAADEIGKVVGSIGIEEILGKIFSGFCIGK